MQCCTLPDRGVGHVKSKPSKGRKRKGHKGRGSLLGKAAKACKGKKKTAFRKCVKAKIKKMK